MDFFLVVFSNSRILQTELSPNTRRVQSHNCFIFRRRMFGFAGNGWVSHSANASTYTYWMCLAGRLFSLCKKSRIPGKGEILCDRTLANGFFAWHLIRSNTGMNGVPVNYTPPFVLRSHKNSGEPENKRPTSCIQRKTLGDEC